MHTDFKQYWENRYKQGQTGWDIGYPSPALIDFVETHLTKDQKILIPGAGNSYEAEYLFAKGYHHIYILDIVKKPLTDFQKRNPLFPENQLLNEDFFKHQSQYDCILEHTFFSSLPPEYRSQYVCHTYDLLRQKGILAGLLFQIDFGNPFPPYGGSYDEYVSLFSQNFMLITMETAKNSIKPRSGNELFFIFEKKPSV